jgi:hypothetical protein
LNCEVPLEREVPPEIERPDDPELDGFERVVAERLVPDGREAVPERVDFVESPAHAQTASDTQPIEAPMIDDVQTCFRM